MDPMADDGAEVTPTLMESVMQRLQAARGHLPEVSRGSGVPYSTLSKIVQGHSPNPRIETVQALLDYFASVDRGTSPRACRCQGRAA